MPPIKPVRGIQLNRAHPLARGLVGCWLMNEGSGVKTYDLSGNRNVATFTNSPIWVTGNHGSAINFAAASSQSVNPAKTPVTGYPYTLLAWFRTTNMATTQALITLYGSGSNWSSLIVAGAIVGDPVIASSRGTTTYLTPKTTVPYISGKWQCAVGVYVSATERYVYLDGGNKVGSADASNPIAFTACDIGEITNSIYMDGDISCAMIWNRALSDAEIAWLYREPFAMFYPLTKMSMVTIAAGGIKNAATIISSAGSLSSRIALDQPISSLMTGKTELYPLLYRQRDLSSKISGAGNLTSRIEKDQLIKSLITGGGELSSKGLEAYREISALISGLGSLTSRIELDQPMSVVPSGKGTVYPQLYRQRILASKISSLTHLYPNLAQTFKSLGVVIRSDGTLTTELTWLPFIGSGAGLLKPLRGTQVNMTHPLARGLVGAWIMNEATGNKTYQLPCSKPADFYGNPQWSMERYGSAINFPTISDYIMQDNIKGFGSSGTILFAMTLDSMPSALSAMVVFGTLAGSYATKAMYIYFNKSTNTLYYSHKNTIAGQAVLLTDNSISAKSCLHYAVTWNLSTGKLYKNGRLKDSEAIAGTPQTIGRLSFNKYDSAISPLNGRIHYLYGYNRVLSITEIQEIYKKPFEIFEPYTHGFRPIIVEAIDYVATQISGKGNIFSRIALDQPLTSLITSDMTLYPDIERDRILQVLITGKGTLYPDLAAAFADIQVLIDSGGTIYPELKRLRNMFTLLTSDTTLTASILRERILQVLITSDCNVYGDLIKTGLFKAVISCSTTLEARITLDLVIKGLIESLTTITSRISRDTGLAALITSDVNLIMDLLVARIPDVYASEIPPPPQYMGDPYVYGQQMGTYLMQLLTDHKLRINEVIQWIQDTNP